MPDPSTPDRSLWPNRVVRLVAGLVVLGTGIAAMALAGLGLGPWEVLHQGIADRVGMTLGTSEIVVGAVVLLAWWPLRQRPGVGTVANTIGVGLVINVWMAWVAPASSLGTQVALFVAGTLLTASGVGLYISAELGPGPRDGLMTGIARRGHPVWLVRSAIEASALATGWLLGGTVGAGTVVFVVAIGPLVHLALVVCGSEAVRNEPELVI